MSDNILDIKVIKDGLKQLRDTRDIKDDLKQLGKWLGYTILFVVCVAGCSFIAYFFLTEPAVTHKGEIAYRLCGIGFGIYALISIFYSLITGLISIFQMVRICFGLLVLGMGRIIKSKRNWDASRVLGLSVGFPSLFVFFVLKLIFQYTHILALLFAICSFGLGIFVLPRFLAMGRKEHDEL